MEKKFKVAAGGNKETKTAGGKKTNMKVVGSPNDPKQKAKDLINEMAKEKEKEASEGNTQKKESTQKEEAKKSFKKAMEDYNKMTDLIFSVGGEKGATLEELSSKLKIPKRLL